MEEQKTVAIGEEEMLARVEMEEEKGFTKKRKDEEEVRKEKMVGRMD